MRRMYAEMPNGSEKVRVEYCKDTKEYRATVTRYDGTTTREPWQESYANLLEAMFPFRAYGSYAMIYYGDDGSILCATCARKVFLHHAEYFAGMSSDRDNDARGEYCSDCYAEIVEPHCTECFDNPYAADNGLKPYIRDSGDDILCAKCVAQARLSEWIAEMPKPHELRAETAGPNTYNVWEWSYAPWNGNQHDYHWERKGQYVAI